MMLTGVREAHAPSTRASLGATRRKSDEYQLRTIVGSCTKRLLMFALRRLWGLRDIDQRRRFMNTRPNATLADFSRARDSQITFSVTHGWSAFWRGRPWFAERRIGETSLAIGSSRFWIGWVTRHGDKCARSTCRD